jgi:hypothetical protein
MGEKCYLHKWEEPMKRMGMLGAIIVMAIVFYGCTATISASPGSGSSTNPATGSTASTASTGGSTSAAEPDWGHQTKTTGCKVNGPFQDTACTPGAIFPDATKAKICVKGYAGSVRNVPTSVKNKVYASYGIKTHKAGQYEVDHLVSLELGGSNDISNLFPEAASPKPGFHEKDKVENYLHNQVCSGKIALKQAQIEIATNWLSVYNRMPKSSSSSSADGTP